MINLKNKTNFKTIKCLTLIAAVISLASVLTGCKDDDDPIIEPKPVIAVSSPSDGASQVSGTTVNLAFTANSGNGLKKVVVKFKSATGSETTKFDTTLASQPSDFNFSRNFIVGSIGTETYTIIVTDKKDNIETKSVNIKSITGFELEDFGTIFHILGSKPGAFDLVKAEQRVISDSDVDKDIVNTSTVGFFAGGWMAKNSTLFVKSLSFDYNTGTINEAKSIYAAGSPNGTVTAPLDGDVYIAKLRGTDTYVIIKVIANDPTNDECGCTNKGKLTFNFKKSL